VDLDATESTFVDLRQQYLKDWLTYIVVRQQRESAEFRAHVRRFLSK
jgi:hypothetical protein